MENLYAQTNVPPRAEPQKLETRERFNGYYNQEIAIDVQKYDFALAFFKEKTGDDAVAHNLTDTIFEVSFNAGYDAMELLDSFRNNTLDDIQKNLIAIVNSYRINTSVLGFANNRTPNHKVVRNILA
tara:strand:+ start:216 stop:596 length:381 start_codon:yes stop_codon:yes gene_type:complete